MGQAQSDNANRLPFETRGQVLKELIASEEKYVLILKKIQSYYQIPLQKRKSIAPEKRVVVIFANCDKLLEIHTSFLEALNKEKDRELEEDEIEAGRQQRARRKSSLIQLVKKKGDAGSDEEPGMSSEERDLAARQFGAVFLDHCNDFETQYSKYVSNYSNALRELILCESKSKFRKFSRKAAKKAGCPLTSFLVLPVLRIGEYAYLMESLAGLTKASHPDYYDCKEAREYISEVSEKINDERRKAENMNNIFQIQFSFVDRLNLIADHRILIKEGEIVWEHKKKEETVHFFLFNDIVVFAKHATTVKQVLTKFSFQKTKYKLLQWFPLYKTRLVASPGSSTSHNQLELTCDKASFTFHVHSKDEQRNYVNIFYKTSVEADLFKDVWPKSTLNILKKKKEDKKKGEKEGMKGEEDEEFVQSFLDNVGAEGEEDDYEETEYEESEWDGESDSEFDDLWSEDEFEDEFNNDDFEEDDDTKGKGTKKAGVKKRDHLVPQKAQTQPNLLKRKTAGGKTLSPLGRSSMGVSTRSFAKVSPRKGHDDSDTEGESEEEDEDEYEDEDEEKTTTKKKQGMSKSLQPTPSRRNLKDEADEGNAHRRRHGHTRRDSDDYDEDEDDVGGSRKGRRRDPEAEGFRRLDGDTPLDNLRRNTEECTACILF